MSIPKTIKVKMHLTGDVRSVAVKEAETLFKAKKASPYRSEGAEKAVKGPAPETAAKNPDSDKPKA
ncbi:hypothetical protein [Aquamicrobium sp. LC103]|uniref:hypothetical protein n=1 Tax=Aquamicrobium sp. LC103 TaxID=1120658 RepID=UPI00063EC672|nr:hypothetical protein [Aquamicrobium sp. LC103]TKT78417.1 hypothetical protein XW59_012440 [Aquamicrobium sp. LC103]